MSWVDWLVVGEVQLMQMERVPKWKKLVSGLSSPSYQKTKDPYSLVTSLNVLISAISKKLLNFM